MDDIDLGAGGSVDFGDDVEKLVAARNPGMAFTLGAMGSRTTNFSNAAYRRSGYDDVDREVQALWIDGDRDAGINTLRVQPEGKTLAERIETLAHTVQLVERVDGEVPSPA